MSEERHQGSTGSAIGLVSALSEELDRQPPRCREAGELTPIDNFPGWLWRDPEERSHGGERRFEVRDCEAEVPAPGSVKLATVDGTSGPRHSSSSKVWLGS